MTRRLRGAPSALAAALLACSLTGQAQPPAPAPAPAQDIGSGFSAAWAREPAQRASALRRTAASAGVRATDRWTPEPATLELTATTDRFTRNRGSREYEATVAMPLWLPGEKSQARAAASAELGAVEARLLAARWRLAAEVRAAYWDCHRARLEWELASQRQASARRLAADVARRAQAGDLARSDHHLADAAVAAADSAQAETSVALTIAAQRWAALTGTAAHALAEPRPEPLPVDAVVEASHPALLELEAKADVARSQRALAGSQKWANPELTVGAVRERGEAGERYVQGVVVGMRVPLGGHGTRDVRVAAASADQLEAETLLALERERLHADIDAARGRVEAWASAVAAAQRRAALAGESVGFFEKSFRLGETDLPTRLRIELDGFEAERHAARSRIEHAAAVSQLRQALGLLPE